jgi:hypothetical protein
VPPAQRDSSFTGSGSNLGRFKSSGGKIVGNTFYRGPTAHNLEIEPLQNWDEGMLGLHDVLIENVRQAGWLASCPLKQPLSHGLVAVMPLRCCRILLLE